jgi:hypothetical protein
MTSDHSSAIAQSEGGQEDRGQEDQEDGCQGVAQVPEPVSPRYRSRVRKVSPRHGSPSVVDLPELHSDLRCLKRAGDGNRTRVLSLGS